MVQSASGLELVAGNPLRCRIVLASGVLELGPTNCAAKHRFHAVHFVSETTVRYSPQRNVRFCAAVLSNLLNAAFAGYSLP